MIKYDLKLNITSFSSVGFPNALATIVLDLTATAKVLGFSGGVEAVLGESNALAEEAT
jgi:hypothetical protein